MVDGTAEDKAMAHLSLEQIAELAGKHEITAEERRAQRVSLIMGLGSKRSTLTRECVEHFLDENEGHTSTAPLMCDPQKTL